MIVGRTYKLSRSLNDVRETSPDGNIRRVANPINSFRIIDMDGLDHLTVRLEPLGVNVALLRTDKYTYKGYSTVTTEIAENTFVFDERLKSGKHYYIGKLPDGTVKTSRDNFYLINV